MLLCYATVILLIFSSTTAQQSPCPEVLTYEAKGAEDDRWYAHLALTSPALLSGIWIRIDLDQRAELIGNWFGESSTDDNKSFLIKDRNYQLKPNGNVLNIRFFVKYTPGGPIPRITRIRLNAKDICPGGDVSSASTEGPKLFISQVKTTTTTAAPKRPDPDGISDDDFKGDFSLTLSPNTPFLTIDVQETCGMVKTAARPLITFGQATLEGEWPWHAALYRNAGLNSRYICGGSLISPRHVLTAAHCVTKAKTGQPVSPEFYTVYLGKYNLYALGPSVQDRTVKKISTHPEFNATYFHNDLALLHLDSPVQISDFVRTVCLWEEDVSLNTITEKLGTVVGWGFDQNGNVTEQLMQSKMPVVSTETCIFSNRDFFSRFTSTKTYCAGFRNGTSACTGDSGGGMVFPKSNTQGPNSIWQLRGVVSLSAALQNQRVVCDTSNYIIFTDVAKHLEWIRNEMKT